MERESTLQRPSRGVSDLWFMHGSVGAERLDSPAVCQHGPYTQMLVPATHCAKAPIIPPKRLPIVQSRHEEGPGGVELECAVRKIQAIQPVAEGSCWSINTRR
jgi:hypothetical protein